MKYPSPEEALPGIGGLSGALSSAMDQEFPAWGILNEPGPAPEWPFFEEWLKAGFYGKLDYMARNAFRRREIAEGYPGIRTLVMALLPHDAGEEASRRHVTFPNGPGVVRVARYAVGPDYHLLFEQAFGRVIGKIRPFLPPTEVPLVKVDHGALLEKSLARRAGLGAIGKNTLLIRPGLGSYFTLGSLLLSTPLPSRIGEHGATEICGSCSRCLDACPTGALVAPFRLDSRRCLSYLTIERPGDDPMELRKKYGGEWLFGCDICQEVCPYNATAIAQEPGGKNVGTGIDSPMSPEDLKAFRSENGALSRVSLARLTSRMGEIVEGATGGSLG